MQFHRILSSCLVAAALVGPPLSASAEPTRLAQTTPAREAKPAAVADARHYAEREQQAPAAAKFEGGGEGVYIGGGVLTVVLIVLLLVLIL